MNKIKILITGASGTVGKEVVDQLSYNEKYSVIAFDLKTKYSEKIFRPYKKKIKIVYGDITNKNDIAKVGENIDIAIHLAAIIPPLADENTPLAYNVNVNGTKNLIDFLKEFSPDVFFIYASSISGYGDRVKNPMIYTTDPLIPSQHDYYAETKIEAEKLLQNSGLKWSIFRLSAIMGYGNHSMSGIMFEMPLNTSMEIVTPKDTGRAFANATKKIDHIKYNIFNLGGGELTRINYKDFMDQSFKINGLGNANFPEYAFADKNYHCGYYADGDKLNNILEFRQDTIEDYFNNLRKNTNPIKRSFTYLFKKPIKRYLLNLSPPYRAYKNNNKEEIQRFFEINKSTIQV